ncbi:hypothetical protein BDBG_03977 [Blastomyces gilchristii SLH14081]|uniref:Uncharacterized protein n=1 Tax=Blastomyces gilchristii (strain SLH14081) TaxID=559298 RepID=A0A179UIY3_BLAGS|nr:uncharacterized protein BDBG_03977 [Blastomyces gilchristii SLH14081]EQL34267.1 hypothetical protein BDFG_03931 [Blastomyces dermatitidis ATCC 26199]OAT07975.1 hypothetical protein BDBG_03977 [Blastomyces gilchristii SLH14081]
MIPAKGSPACSDDLRRDACDSDIIVDFATLLTFEPVGGGREYLTLTRSSLCASLRGLAANDLYQERRRNYQSLIQPPNPGRLLRGFVGLKARMNLGHLGCG